MKKRRQKEFIPEFDSSSSMLFHLGNYLFGRDEAVGLPPKLPRMLGDVINMTPVALRKSGYKAGGVSEALSMSILRKISDEKLSRWVMDAYPRRKYPAVAIGSSNGALIHMCAMMGIPWIPQTVLVAVRRMMDPDELVKDMKWGKRAAAVLRERLPGFRLHQMHDPIQDRIMITNMGYFRLKRLRLGGCIEEYLENTLVPGGTIFISDCDYKWPCYKADEAHYFQTGGLGDVGGEEYAEGSERIKEFLEREGSFREKWETPGPLEDVPEGEWGFDPALEEDVKRFASDKGYKVYRMRYGHPDIMSPMAADMTRDWYAANGIKDKRYLVECFALIEPLLAARTGSIPYWMAFNTTTSFEPLKKYMRSAKKAAELYVMIMSNAVKGIGLVPIGDWEEFMKSAASTSSFLGVNKKKYPFDLGSFIKYHKDLRKKIDARYFLPDRMSVEDFIGRMRDSAEKYKVDFRRVYLKRKGRN